ncbi:MAG: hypothetical protein J07HX64_00128 [halophilic archaeon J07HX64]|jgi:hypothetical protein|nr:MAG: hypothetical protein J07HX64_00128 [halophilic archaeon J07HX64]
MQQNEQSRSVEQGERLMEPPDPADAHLADRILEFRAVKSLAAVFVLSLATVFYGWVPVVVVFSLGYIAYKYRYYANRVGVYSTGDLAARRDRLEYAMLGFVVVTVGVGVAIQAVFPTEEWTVGEFLSLPAVDFRDVNGLLDSPVEAAAWGVVVAPVAVLSCVAVQFRQRLLVGVNSRLAAVRAALYDSLFCLPIALLWVGVFTLRPVFEVWRPAVESVESELGLEPSVAVGPALPDGEAVPEGTELPELAVIFESALVPLATAAVATPVAVVAVYSGIQRWKYGNNTVPELLGYRGLFTPSWDVHSFNIAVPLGVFLLYAAAVLGVFGTSPVTEPAALGAAAVAVVVAANPQARTTSTLERLPGSVLAGADAVVAGLAVGGLAFVALAPLVGLDTTLVSVALAYPVLGAPVAYAANRAVAHRAVGTVSTFGERVADGAGVYDQATVDRLFVYSHTRDDRLRAAAVGALATAVQVEGYRRDEALALFGRAAGSKNEQLAHAGLRGIADVLRDDQSHTSYERLVDCGIPNRVLAGLERDGEARPQAAEAAARVLRVELELTAVTAPEQLDDRHVTELCEIASQHPRHGLLIDAVVKYTARLYEEGAPRVEANSPVLQELLGSLLELSVYGSDRAALAAALAVTGEETTADTQRFEQAVGAMAADREETRYIATHVVSSSMERHAEAVDTGQLVAQLRDTSPAVRRMGATALSRLLQFDPDRGPELLDPLVVNLEESAEDPGPAAATVLETLSGVDLAVLLEHPTAASAIAPLVGEPYPAVARPASELLGRLVGASPSLADRGVVGAALEDGLVHSTETVRRACAEAVASVVEADTTAGQRFVGGLGANLGTEGREGVLAVVTLRQVSGTHPDRVLDIVPALADGLDNQTSIDTRTVPFVVRGGTVSAVTVEIISNTISREPGRGKELIAPLVDLVPTASVATKQDIFEILAALAQEFPERSAVAVDAAADGLQAGRSAIRRDAAEVLASVAAYHPERVTTTVDALVATTDDSSPRVRTPALIALRNICTALPGAVESDMYRVVGCLDDDSATVREHAGRLVITVAEREPGVVEPAADTADRLRRLQRDPAVDIDPERLQDASTAIQTGVPVEEDTADSEDQQEVWSPEPSDGMGASGETNVFDPVGDEFEGTFDDEIESDSEATADDPVADRATSLDTGPGGSGQEQSRDGPADVGDHDTVVPGGGDGTTEPSDSGGGLSDRDTLVQGGGDDSDDTDDSSDSGAGLGDRDTVVEGGSDDSDGTDDIGDTGGGLGDRDTVVQGGGDDSDDTDDTGDSGSGLSDHDTVIQAVGDDSDDTDDIGNTGGGLGDRDTVVQGGGDDSGDTDDGGGPDDSDGGLGDQDTVIQGGERNGSDETDDTDEGSGG